MESRFLAIFLLASQIGTAVSSNYYATNYDDLIETLMTTDMTPNPGPDMDTVYVPGTPGGQWTPEEIDITRYTYLKLFRISFHH